MTTPPSPLPWKVLENYIVALEGNLLCCGVDNTHPEGRANAAYIVQACNAYPKLVEALEKIAKDKTTCDGHKLPVCGDIAREALRGVKENG